MKKAWSRSSHGDDPDMLRSHEAGEQGAENLFA